MKYTSFSPKIARSLACSFSLGTPNGLVGATLIPPAYGIDVIDQQPIQAVSEPGQDYQPLASVTWPGWAGVMQRKEALSGAQPPQN